MLKRRTWLILEAGMVAAIALLALYARLREPHYQGVSLSGWLEDYQSNWEQGRSCQQDADAVRAIGTNALPTLVRWFTYQPSPAKNRWTMAVQMLPYSIQYSPPVQDLLGDHANEQFYRAWTGIRLLGSNAQSFIPELASLATNTMNPERAMDAGRLLGCLGPAAVPALLDIVTNCPRPYLRGTAISSLGRVGPEAAPAIPTLIQCLGDPSEWAADSAAGALGRIHEEPETVIPALIACLKDPRADVRATAAHALGRFGADALPAVPALLQLLKDGGPEETSMARGALWDIAPEALTNAPPR